MHSLKTTELLLTCMAWTDALFRPLRNPRDASWAAVWALRARHGSQGLPYRSEGGMADSRALTQAVEAGWIRRFRGERKTKGVALTMPGLTEAWKLLSIPQDDAIVIAREVARRGPGWVAEVALNNGRGWGDGHHQELDLLERFYRPALAARWIESHCDSCSRVGYRCTPAGFEAMKSHPADAEPMPDPPPANRAAIETYCRSFVEAASWLESKSAITVDCRGELGEIPLSAAVWASSLAGRALA